MGNGSSRRRRTPRGCGMQIGRAHDRSSDLDAQTGQPLTQPMKHSRYVSSAQFSPDGKRIVTASTNTARVWDADRKSTRPLFRSGCANRPTLDPTDETQPLCKLSPIQSGWETDRHGVDEHRAGVGCRSEEHTTALPIWMRKPANP